MTRSYQGDAFGWQDGSAAEPPICFQSEPTVGLYRPAPGVMGFARQAEAKPGALNIAAPLAGDTVTMVAGQGNQILNPAGTLATLTLVLPPTPADGQIAHFSTTQTITALTLNAAAGDSILGAVTTLGAGNGRDYIYQLSSKTWFPE